jgi:hypothetical protein
MCSGPEDKTDAPNRVAIRAVGDGLRSGDLGLIQARFHPHIGGDEWVEEPVIRRRRKHASRDLAIRPRPQAAGDPRRTMPLDIDERFAEAAEVAEDDVWTHERFFAGGRSLWIEAFCGDSRAGPRVGDGGKVPPDDIDETDPFCNVSGCPCRGIGANDADRRVRVVGRRRGKIDLDSRWVGRDGRDRREQRPFLCVDALIVNNPRSGCLTVDEVHQTLLACTG